VWLQLLGGSHVRELPEGEFFLTFLPHQYLFELLFLEQYIELQLFLFLL
jgi:hypothetical protein